VALISNKLKTTTSSEIKISFIGAGSIAFIQTLINDILQVDSLSSAHSALMDINGERLHQSFAVAQRMVDAL